MILHEENEISLAHLPSGFGHHQVGAGTGNANVELPLDGLNLDALINQIERDLIEQALQRTGGRKKDDANLLGITFRSFRYRLDKLDMT